MKEQERTNYTGMTKEVWLYMLKEGGRWSGAELCKAMNSEHGRMAVLLGNLSGSGMVTRYEKTGGSQGRLRYAVTPSCKAPHGVTIAELIATGVFKAGA